MERNQDNMKLKFLLGNFMVCTALFMQYFCSVALTYWSWFVPDGQPNRHECSEWTYGLVWGELIAQADEMGGRLNMEKIARSAASFSRCVGHQCCSTSVRQWTITATAHSGWVECEKSSKCALECRVRQHRTASGFNKSLAKCGVTNKPLVCVATLYSKKLWLL